jgi:predicted nucleic acid-binding protein
VTTNFVVDETLTLLTRRADAHLAARVGRQLYASRALSILRPDEEIEIQALAWMERFHDQTLSFTDCVSFVLMENHRLRRVFTFDRDFEIAGFEKIAVSR